jgi:hypothetical protein
VARKISLSISSIGDSDSPGILPKLNAEEVKNFKISTAGILQDIDLISLENDKRDLIGVNPNVKSEINEGKEKLMRIN